MTRREQLILVGGLIKELRDAKDICEKPYTNIKSNFDAAISALERVQSEIEVSDLIDEYFENRCAMDERELTEVISDFFTKGE